MPDINPQHLLGRAQEALPQAPGAPRQAVLRRGVSDAYCALFHHLTDAVARQALAGIPASTVQPYRRTLAHADLKFVSNAIVSPKAKIAPTVLASHARADASVRSVAQAFVDLQEERHRADYDHADVFDARRLADAIASAASAITDIDQARTQAPMRSYLGLLALGSSWVRSK